MKRAISTPYSFEGRYELIQEVLEDLVVPRLLERRRWTLDTTLPPLVHWAFARTSDGSYQLQINVAREVGVCRKEYDLTTRNWGSLDYVMHSAVESAFLAAFTKECSDMIPVGRKWDMRSHIYG